MSNAATGYEDAIPKRPALQTEVREAISSDDAEKVSELLKDEPAKGFCFWETDGCGELCGYTPLLLAAKLGSQKIVELLLNLEVDIRVGKTWQRCKPGGESALHIAAQNGHSKIVDTLLEAAEGLLKLEDKQERTALIHAARGMDKLTTQFLLDKGANTAAGDFEGATALHHAARNGNCDIIDALLSNGAPKQQPDIFGRTPARYDAIAGHRDAFEKILQKLKHSAVEVECRTALIPAARRNHIDVVEYILSREECFTALDAKRRNVLHIACVNSNAKLCRIILTNLLGESATRGRILARNIITMNDIDGKTPLGLAVHSSCTNIALELLRTPVYFPPSPTSDAIFISNSEEKKSVANRLKELIQDQLCEETQRSREAMTYWAILNGADDLVDIDGLPELQRDGATWRHIAALGGNVAIAKSLFQTERDVVARGARGLTPLHLAAQHGHFEMVEHLATLLVQGSGGQKSLLDALAQSTDDDETPLTLAAAGKSRQHEEIEGLFWEKLEECDGGVLFPRGSSIQTSPVLELAARLGRPGQEMQLHTLFAKLQNVRLGLDSSEVRLEPGCDALGWAVYYRCPMVIWWLLAKEGYTDGAGIERTRRINVKIKEAKKRVQTDENDTDEVDDLVSDIIEALLRDPPPVTTPLAPRDDEWSPSFLFEGETDNHELLGAVIDFQPKPGRHRFQVKHREVGKIIYSEGPNRIMRDEGYRQYSLLRRKVLTAVSPSSNTPLQTADEAAETKKDQDDRPLENAIRRIHIPANSDLMVRLSRDANRLNRDHRPLVAFAKESCVELPAGGKKLFMRPQCVRHTQTGGSNGSVPRAIFFPHLSWSKKPEPRAQAQGRSQKVQEAPAHQSGTSYPIAEHESITLDQYYYTCLDCTDDRDQDQVLSRYIAERDDAYQKDKKELNPPMTPQTSCSTSASKCTIDLILVVNQVWLWVVDDQTIILSTTHLLEDANNDLLQHVVRELGSWTTDSLAMDMDVVIHLVLGTAVDLFRKKEIEITGLKMSALRVFRDSIRIVRDKEAHLFDDFQKTIDATRQPKQDVFGDISLEVELLREIKDINDELNILKLLAEDQERVWQQVFDGGNGARRDIIPTVVKVEIVEMIHEANQVQESVDKLLDFKQKRASLVEASSASKHAQDAAAQTRLMKFLGVFTALAVCPSVVLSFFTIPLDIFHREGDAIVIKTRVLVAAITVFTICVIGTFWTAYLQGHKPVISATTESTPRAEPKKESEARPKPVTGDEIV